STPNPIKLGESVTLSWGVAGNVESVVIEPDLMGVPPKGRRVLSPARTTTYTITASGPGGTATTTRTVDVKVPPVISFVATPAITAPNQPVRLAWKVTGEVTSVAIGKEPVPSSGARTVNVGATTEFVLTAGGPGGAASKAVTIRVSSEHPKIVSFESRP